MGDVGACWDNAVEERFFGSLKNDWLLKVPQLTREHMRNDVATYSDITIQIGFILLTTICRQLTMKFLLEKCPEKLEQNTPTLELKTLTT